MNTSNMKRIAFSARYDLEVFVRYDAAADIYELFASSDADDYIGCADDLTEAKQFAQDWIDERGMQS